MTLYSSSPDSSGQHPVVRRPSAIAGVRRGRPAERGRCPVEACGVYRLMLLASFLAAISASTVVLTGCSKLGSGCTKDADCKGDRICNSGACADPPPASSTLPPRSPSQLNPAPIPQRSTPEPTTTQAVRFASDGLPEEIPPPGSSVPTLAEWSAARREVTVRGSDRLNCETKMVREWLRVTCLENSKGVPVEVYDETGHRAFTFTGNGRNSVVVRVIRDEIYKTRYVWDMNGHRSGAQLVISWLPGMARPELYFVED